MLELGVIFFSGGARATYRGVFAMLRVVHYLFVFGSSPACGNFLHVSVIILDFIARYRYMGIIYQVNESTFFLYNHIILC